MNSIEVYDEIIKSGIFNSFYKTKACFQVSQIEILYGSAGEVTDNTRILGFSNHGKKYEYKERAMIDKNFKDIEFEYDFREVEQFSDYDDNKSTFAVNINLDILPTTNANEEFEAVVSPMEEIDEYDILPGDIILTNLVVLSKERPINGTVCGGIMDTFYGKSLTLKEYREKFLGVTTKQKSKTIDDLILDLSKNSEIKEYNLNESDEHLGL